MASTSEAGGRRFTARGGGGSPVRAAMKPRCRACSRSYDRLLSHRRSLMKKKLLLWQGRGSAPVTSISVTFACREKTDQSAQVRSTGITEKEPPLTRHQCRCAELCVLTASEIDRRPDLVSQLVADTPHPMEVK